MTEKLLPCPIACLPLTEAAIAAMPPVIEKEWKARGKDGRAIAPPNTLVFRPDGFGWFLPERRSKTNRRGANLVGANVYAMKERINELERNVIEMSVGEIADVIRPHIVVAKNVMPAAQALAALCEGGKSIRVTND